MSASPGAARTSLGGGRVWTRARVGCSILRRGAEAQAQRPDRGGRGRRAGGGRIGYIVRLLGGSKPNEMADVRREGGSVSDGTLGSLTGDASHFSVCTAYQLWAQGLARCMGRVLFASRAAEGEEAVLGVSRDFDVQTNLLRIPHTMSNSGLRSTCRHLSRKIAFSLQTYHSRPGESLPNIRAIAAETGGAVLEKRLQDSEYERKSADHVARMQKGFEERMRALERRVPREDNGSQQRHSSRGGRDVDDLYRGGRHRGGGKAGDADGGAARRPPRNDERISSKLDAVRALQELARKRLGLPLDRNNGKAEPCAWEAVNGECTNQEGVRVMRGEAQDAGGPGQASSS
ncbi:MAG: hypothetical protein SGPRY_002875 [Prymnesium sp.]